MNPSNLTQQELVALALRHMQEGDSARAMTCLKQATAQPDATAEACFLLGSQYAQLQLMLDARTWMQRAIELRPDFDLARFQLGLLLLTQGLPVEAQATWQALENLAHDNPLTAFRQGLLHLIKDEWADAVCCLEEGIRLNSTQYPVLNQDMQMLIHEVQALQAKHESQAVEAPLATLAEADAAGDGDDPQHHVFLNAYRR